MVNKIRLEQVSLVLEKPILTNISIEFQPGITCLLGPNGAGKTMTNRLIGLLQKVTAGTIHWGDKLINPFDGNRLEQIRSIGYMHQQPVFVNKSVEENIELPLKFRGQVDRQPRVDQVLEEFDLEELRDSNALKLSKGQQQRVALARTMVTDPELIILDEPTSSLDMQTTKWFENYLIELRNNSTKLIIWTTHDQFQVRRIADRIAVILDGQIQEHGTAKDVLHQPTNPLVERYLSGELI